MVNSVITTNDSNDKYKNILEYLLAIVTILQCNSIYIFQVNHDKLIVNLIFQLLLFIISIYFFTSIRYEKSYLYKLISFLFIFCMISISYYIFEFIYYPQFKKIFLIRLFLDPLFIIIYFFSCMYKYKDVNSFFYKLENIVLILATLSFPFWLMSNLGVSPTTTITTSKWYSSNSAVPIDSYFHLGFIVKSYSNLFGMDWIRNSGIFTEASMFAYVLTIALCVEIFMKKNNKLLNKKVIILLIAILSTSSTTSIIFSIGALCFKEFILQKNNNWYKYFLLISVPLVIIFLHYVIHDKVNNSSSALADSSYSVRMDDIRAGISAWKNHLIIGNGLGNNTAIQSYIETWRFLSGHAGISAGFTTVLACGGIVLGLYYLLPLIFSYTTSPYTFGFGMFTLVPIIFVSVQDTYLCIIIIFYLWARILFKYKKYVLLKGSND